MIRATLLKVVQDVLSSHSFFAGEDFRLEEFLNSGKEPCLAIKYRYDPRFFFNFHVPKSKSKTDYSERYVFSCTVNPGRESAEERISTEERDGLLAEIAAWLVRLHEDVVSAPVLRQFAEHEDALKKMRERLDQLPDEPLSSQDKAEFLANLDQLKAELTEQLKRETEDRDTLKRRIEELGRDIGFLKATLESMTRRNWAEALIVRIQRWKSRFSLRQLAAGARVAKALLPPNMAEQLESVVHVAEGVADIAEGNAETRQ